MGHITKDKERRKRLFLTAKSVPIFSFDVLTFMKGAYQLFTNGIVLRLFFLNLGVCYYLSLYFRSTGVPSYWSYCLVLQTLILSTSSSEMLGFQQGIPLHVYLHAPFINMATNFSCSTC